jgi:hypothetical protein
MAMKSKMARASLGVTLTIMALVGLAHPGTGRAADKIVICHFQTDTQSWRKLEVVEKAAAAHLANHDDAFPGGTTSVTSTSLDSSCQPQPVVCPCWTVETLRQAREAAIARGDTEIECGIVDEVIASIEFLGTEPVLTLAVATTNGCTPVTDPCCAVGADDSGTFPVGLAIHIEGATFNVCRQQIVQACTP